MGYFFHYPLVVDYLVATKDPKALPKEIQNAGYQVVNWNATTSTLPTIEAPADLFVYKDSLELNKINWQVLATNVANNVKEGGFLFAVFRSNLCKAESLLRHLAGKGPSLYRCVCVSTKCLLMFTRVRPNSRITAKAHH